MSLRAPPVSRYGIGELWRARCSELYSLFLQVPHACWRALLLSWRDFSCHGKRRRTIKEERSDYALLASLLRLNMGRGFCRYDDFQRGRALALSDASKSPGYTGGGYVTRGVRNSYHFYKYGGRASRRSIMVHEGDTALKCGSDNGYLWRGLVVDFGVDNTSLVVRCRRATPGLGSSHSCANSGSCFRYDTASWSTGSGYLRRIICSLITCPGDASANFWRM